MARNFANSAGAVVRTTSMEHVAQQVARDNARRDSLVNVQTVDPKVFQSMQNQGMWNTDGWGPGAPITPNHPVGTEPRAMEYMIGQNIVQAPRSTEAIGFDTMKNIIEMYDVAQMCIEVRQDELRNLDWNIVPYDEADTDKYDSEINQVRKFFERPDGYMTFDTFQSRLAYDWQAYDSLAIFPHLTKGGKLGALEPVDGKTITPMVDYDGRVPQAPAPAYVQYMYGLPWVWLDRDNLIYVPFRQRNHTLYGYPAVEWLLNNVNTDIRWQLFFLQYFTEGTVPDVWINAPEGVTDPNQIKSIQQMYDAVLAGNQAHKHKAKWIPAGSKVQDTKQHTFDDKMAMYLLTKTCAAFKVQPSEIGFTEKVNKSSGETQENAQYRRSIKPGAMYLSRIYTHIIHKYFGYTNLYFKYLNLDEQEDLLLMAQRDKIYASIGAISPDEIRVQRLGLDVDAQNPVPRMFITNSQAIPVEDAIRQSAAGIRQVEAETDAQVAQAGIDPETETEQLTDQDPSVTSELLDEESAVKARQDFFVKPTKRRQHTQALTSGRQR